MKVRLGIDLGGTFIKAGMIEYSTAKPITHFKHPTEALTNPKTVIGNLNDAYDRLRDICKQKGYKPISLGIGSPGTIGQPDGKVTDASPNIKKWKGVVLTKIFGKTDIPVFADNDANCAALAEYYSGLKGKFNSMVFITVGTGIGGGLILDGKLFRGSNSAGAELGHTTIVRNGRKCKCGRKGCLEAYASVPNLMKQFVGLAKKAHRKIDKDISPQELFSLYKKGDRVAVQAITDNADYLGVGIGSFVNVLNPEIVVIGGGFSGTGREYIRLIHSSIMEHAFRAATSKLKVVKAKMGNNAGFIGAALLGMVDKDGKIKGR